MLFCEVHSALFSIESAIILSQPPSPVHVLEGQPLKLAWSFSVQGTFCRVEFVFAEGQAFILDMSLTTTFVEPAFVGRLTASTTGRNATITFFSVNRTDSNNYVFKVLDSDSRTTQVPLDVIVEYGVCTRLQN